MDAARDLPSPELALACAVLVAAALAAYFKLPVRAWWERPLSLVARHPRFAIVVAALLPLILRLALLIRFPAPEPRLHDEFSFLLGARTLLEGRLANPPHPFWPHFESMHILVRPSYASAFPLGQAAVLAVGFLFGHPWIGVWLSVGVMCGCVCWMLLGWVPPRWALLGALLVAFRFGVSSYWMNSYWGGALAAAGGALVLGSLSRLRDRLHWQSSLILGLGIAVLALTRAFEGAVFALFAATVLLTWMLRTGRPWGAVMRHVVVPLGMVMAILTAVLCLYFARVTGSPWTPPYVLYRSSMTMAPHFVWQTERPEPLYNNREMRHFYAGLEMRAFRHARDTPWTSLAEKAAHYWRFYLGPILTIPILTIPLLWPYRPIRVLLWLIGGFSLALVGQVWHNAHYAAPATGLIMLITVVGMRRLSIVRWKRRKIGRWLVRLIPVACVAMLVFQGSAARVGEGNARADWRWPSPGGVGRAHVLRNLENIPGEHLLFVRYGPWHDPGDEWVYNDADIDGSRVVWARELDRFSNSKLITYFHSRRAWLVEPDTSMAVVPYDTAPPRAMPFVPLGAPGIESLRSVEEVARKIHHLVGDKPLGCDEWNYYFTEATGVMGPDVAKGCYIGNDRGQLVSFQTYFAWMQQAR